MITLLQLTDMHLLAAAEGMLLGVNTRQSFRAVLQHVKAGGRQADYMLATGDLTQDASPAAYRRFMTMASQLDVPVMALSGNHDVTGQLQQSLGALATPVVDCGAWRLVLLDTSIQGAKGGHLATDQLALLDEACRVESGRHVLVAMHHHPVPMRSTWLDTLKIDNGQALIERAARLPQIKGLVWGHVHQAFDNVQISSGGETLFRLMATPSTCFQFKPYSRDFALDMVAPGYRWIHLHHDGRIDTEVVRLPSLPAGAGKPDLAKAGY